MELSSKLLLYYTPQVRRATPLGTGTALLGPRPPGTRPGLLGCSHGVLFQACRNNICLDLSPSHSLDGRLTGHKVVNWDIKVGWAQGDPSTPWPGGRGIPPGAQSQGRTPTGALDPAETLPVVLGPP